MNYRINSIISKVTVLATIFVPLHLVTGLFGMNVQVPGQNADNLGWWFGILGVFIAFMVLGLSVSWKLKLL